MRELQRVSQALHGLRSQLQATANRLWKLKFALNSAFYHGLSERDFLPRRIQERRREEEARLADLLLRVKSLLDAELDSPLFALAGHQDADTLEEIHRTLRYLKNAYCAEAPMFAALARVRSALPRKAAR